MAALIWGAWGVEWGLAEKVSFNGATRHITVNDGVTAVDVAADVYSAWVRWTQREPWAVAAMRYSGYDPIPGGRTGATFFAINGWKLVYDPNIVAVSGVLYSEDYPTAFWSDTGSPLYPATVSSLVNSAVTTENVVTGTALTAEQTAAAVWQAAARTLTATLDPTAAQIVAALMASLQSTAIPVNTVQIKGQAITGAGTEADPWGP